MTPRSSNALFVLLLDAAFGGELACPRADLLDNTANERFTVPNQSRYLECIQPAQAEARLIPNRLTYVAVMILIMTSRSSFARSRLSALGFDFSYLRPLHLLETALRRSRRPWTPAFISSNFCHPAEKTSRGMSAVERRSTFPASGSPLRYHIKRIGGMPSQMADSTRS